MTTRERQQQFEEAVNTHEIRRAHARVARNFGFSNSARVLEGGLFACTNNLEAYSKSLAEGQEPVEQFIMLCVLTFPPQDEVYFGIVVTSEGSRVNDGLLKLFREGEARNTAASAAGESIGKINNNVKFYITDSGRLFFHNVDFFDSLTEAREKGELDPDCMAAVDAILFTIWPPAASASRSLLARDFVGYLGRLIGREKVHEINVFRDPAEVRPEMRRMPDSIPIEDIEAAIATAGGYYPGGQIRRYHTALNFLEHKHFVILTGLSGTGKTLLALRYARAVHGISDDKVEDPFLFLCAVRPEWTDPTGLTGYYDVLSNRYVVPQFLEAVLTATAYRESPVFVVLDEMNLARVEYYLSDVLSAIETREALQLHSNGVPLEGTTGTTIPAALPLPPNLYITGTINVDETTNPVSDKVLDRAVVIDVSTVDLQGFLVALVAREPELAGARGACEPSLLAAEELMSRHGLGFGYRVAEEVVRYHTFATDRLHLDAVSVRDDLMLQKVLVKLRGGERQRVLLTDLNAALADLPRSMAYIAYLLAQLDEFGSFQASR